MLLGLVAHFVTMPADAHAAPSVPAPPRPGHLSNMTTAAMRLSNLSTPEGKIVLVASFCFAGGPPIARRLLLHPSAAQPAVKALPVPAKSVLGSMISLGWRPAVAWAASRKAARTWVRTLLPTPSKAALSKAGGAAAVTRGAAARKGVVRGSLAALGAVVIGIFW